MYLAMARVAHREGYPEIGLYWEKAAWEEAEHAAKFAELLGEVVTDSTKKNLEMRVEAENGATAGKFDLAKRAKELNLDAIHDTVHEMARDEASQRLDALAGSVGEQQVADSRHKLAHLTATAVANHLPTHGDEALHALALKVVASLELTAESGTHGKPVGLLSRGVQTGVGYRLHGGGQL